MRIRETKLYHFNELSDEAKETAIEEFHGINTDWLDWANYVIEDAKEIGRLMGIDIDKVYYTGFWSKGDGACFEGNYMYKKGSVKAIIEYAPTDEELHRIVRELQSTQKKVFYQVKASVKQSGHYSHRFCTDFSVDFESWFTGKDYYNQKAEEVIIETLRDYMLWIYKRLEAEYDYQTTKEAIIETIEANKYEFTEDGECA